MQLLTSVRALAKSTAKCPACGRRPYSFAAEVQRLLRSLEASSTTSSSSVPPIIPATRQRLDAFYRDTKNASISTRTLTRDYKQLHRHSSIRALPSQTAKLYLARLLREGDTSTATSVLLDYELDEAVSIAKDALLTMSLFQREESTITLWRGLRRTSQKGLAYQILLESGYNAGQIDALKRLMMIQERVAHAQSDDLKDIHMLLTNLLREMRQDDKVGSSLDTCSAKLLMQRSLELKASDFSFQLFRRNLHATAAVKIYLKSLGKEDEMINVAIAAVSSNHLGLSGQIGYSIDSAAWVWLVEQTTNATNLLKIMEQKPNEPELRAAIALKSATFSSTLNNSFMAASSLPLEYWPRLLHHWSSHKIVQSQPISPFRSQIVAMLATLKDSELNDVFSNYLEMLQDITAGHLHNYDIDNLMLVLEIANAIPWEMPLALQTDILKHFSNRPAEHISRLAKLNGIDCANLQALIKLRSRKVIAMDKMVQDEITSPGFLAVKDNTASSSFSKNLIQGEVKLITQLFELIRGRSASPDSSFSEAQIIECYRTIISTLLRLSSTRFVASFIEATRLHGQLPSPDMAPLLIRRLSPDRENLQLLLSLFKDYPEGTMDYVTWARCISASSLEDPELAMDSMKRMISHGLKPDQRLFHEIMMAVSASSALTDHDAFRYLQDLYHASRKFMLERDTIHLASFLNVILVRQGLAVDTQRIAWLLRLSEQILSRNASIGVTQAEVVEVLHRWALYDKSKGRHSDARPKKLREIIDRLVLHSQKL